MGDKAEGWKNIANVIGVHERTARRYAMQEADPLPVRWGHRGAWAYVNALLRWAAARDRAYAEYRAERSR